MQLDVDGDFAVVDNLQTVTLFRRTGTSTFAEGVPVENALQRNGKKTVVDVDGAKLRRQGCRWHLWEAELPPDVEVKVGDVVRGADGKRWTVQAADNATLKSRWALDTVQEL